MLAQALRAAHANGVLDPVLDDLVETGLADRERTAETLARASAKAWRYVDEMRQIAATQASVGLPPELFEAFAVVYAGLAEQAVADAPEQVDGALSLVDVLERLNAAASGRAGAEVRQETRDRVDGSPDLLRRVRPDERGSDQRASGPTQWLRRHQLPPGLDEPEPCQLVAAVEREAREDLATEVGRPHAVPGEAEAVVHSAAAPEDREVGGGDVDRPAPAWVRRRPRSAGKQRTRSRAAVAITPRSSSSRLSGRAPKPILPPPQPKAMRPSRVVRR